MHVAPSGIFVSHPAPEQTEPGEETSACVPFLSGPQDRVWASTAREYGQDMQVSWCVAFFLCAPCVALEGGTVLCKEKVEIF